MAGFSFGIGKSRGSVSRQESRYAPVEPQGKRVNPNRHYTDNSYEDMYRWRPPQGESEGFKSIYDNTRVFVSPYTGSDIAPWFGGKKRLKTEQEYNDEWTLKFNDLNRRRQQEWKNWQIGQAKKQQDEDTAAYKAEMERLQREYDKQRKEMARRMEEQRIASQNQLAAAKAKGNKSARPETGAYEGEPTERRGGGDDGGTSGTLLTRPGEKPTLGKRGRLGSKTLLGG